MPVNKSYVRHTMKWTMSGGEVASTSCAWSLPSSIISLSTADVDIFANKASAFWTAVKGRYGASVSFVGSTIRWVGIDDNTVEVYERAVTASPGTSASASLPTEVAVTASLRTNTYGRTGRGRMYLPNPSAANLNSDGTIDGTFLSPVLTALQTYLASSGSGPFRAGVVSQTAGVVRDVTSVQLGTVFDAQRRRRDKLIEVYSTAVVS